MFLSRPLLVCSCCVALGVYFLLEKVSAFHARSQLQWYILGSAISAIKPFHRSSDDPRVAHVTMNATTLEPQTEQAPEKPPLVQIAPMLEITYFEFRHFMRLLTKRAQLWTEMIPDSTVLHAEQETLNHMLECHPRESPIVVQLGGNNAETLRKAAKVVLAHGYDEINLNVGCPSARVSGKGCFGASLMYNADLVRDVIRDLRENVPVPVTVKHRLGVDHHDSYEFLHGFISTVAASGCTHYIVHARKAWLKGINPKQNRSIPPLDYERVYKLKQDFPKLNFSINGGFKTIGQMKEALSRGAYGVMVGRLAYENPCELARVDTEIYGEPSNPETCKTRRRLLEAYADFIDETSYRNAKMHICMVVKPILGTFHGEYGTRVFRQALSEMKVYETLEYVKGKTKHAQFIHRAIDIMATVNPEALDRPLH